MKKLIAVILQILFAASASAVTITELIQVPGLTDLTATYQFTSDKEGTILYGGSCGTGDLAHAAIGSNTVTWTLTDGSYNDCTITVNDSVSNSNTLMVPSFKATNKYPVVFVHGLYSNSFAWTCRECAIDYLRKEGWETELLIARSISDSCVEFGGTPNCNDILCDITHPQILAGWIDDVLSNYPRFDRIDLVGHSRGGMNIMTGLWHGYIDPGKVRHAVTLSGSNRTDVLCDPESPFPPIPEDETPGHVRYAIYWSNCDRAVSYDTTYVSDGAYLEDLSEPDGICLDHIDMAIDPVVLTAIKSALLTEIEAPPPTEATSTGADQFDPTVATNGGGGGCFITGTF